ncbi:MAG: CHAT domain-containing protein [Caldilineaceae bacterium]|nr:CHAT domain-containing protein [Caldilineaceae bacterium]
MSNLTKLLAGTLLAGMGIATGQATVIATVAGAGVNLASDGLGDLWAGMGDAPPQPLAAAYARSIRAGVEALKTRYRTTVDPRAGLDAFELTAACADEIAEAEFPASAQSVNAAQAGLRGSLAALLHGHDERQVAFLARELLPACAGAFQAELVRDETAWRAFHGRLLQQLAGQSGRVMQQMEAGGDNMAQAMDDFTRLLTTWSNPNQMLDEVRALHEEIIRLAGAGATPLRFDNRGMQVRGSVYQAQGDQYINSAHAQSGGTATVVNNFGAPARRARADTPPAPQPILLLAANPVDTQRLRLDEEARRIDRALRAGGGSTRLTLVHEWAARSDEVLDALLRHRPAVIHFAGHGEEDRLIFEGIGGQGARLSAQALAGLVAAAGGVRCVVLNACWSQSVGDALLDVVPCVAGMAGAVDDALAVAFAGGFYRALAAGESVARAVSLGRAQSMAEDPEGVGIVNLALQTAPDVDADAIRFGA